MARPGISYNDVATAAVQLVEQQQRPSIEAIRRVLGTGSNSTINQHLREWRKTHGNKIELEQGLPEPLLVAVRGLYEAICAQGNDKLEQLTEQYKQTISELHQKIESLEKSNQQLIEENSQITCNNIELHSEKSKLEKLNNQLNKKLDEKAAENNLSIERLNDKASEIKRLIEQVKTFQDNLNHYRDSIREERKLERQKFEDDLVKLKSTLDTQGKMAQEAQKEIIMLKQQLQHINTENSDAKAKLAETIKQNNNSEMAKHELEIKHQKLEHDYQRISGELQNSKQDGAENKSKLDELVVNLEKYKERAAIYEMNLNKAEDIVTALRDKNLFLSQEKIELSQQLNKALREA